MPRVIWPTGTYSTVCFLHLYRLLCAMAIKKEERLPLLTALPGWERVVKYSAIINGAERSEAAGSGRSVFCGMPNVPPYECRARTCKQPCHTAGYNQSWPSAFGTRVFIGYIQYSVYKKAALLAFGRSNISPRFRLVNSISVPSQLSGRVGKNIERERKATMICLRNRFSFSKLNAA